MVLYLIKSGLCLALVLGTYHLFLEDKKMHQFNRWFLLFGLAFSFLVPLLETSFSIDFSHYLNQPEVMANTGSTTEGLTFVSSDASQLTTTNSEKYSIVLALASLISTLLFIRFGYNITTLVQKAISNERINYKGAKLVLIKEKILPHTFGKYIFINKSDYQNQKIEAALFTHELTHARQWHSLDIVLIEALQIVFWINPLLFFYKKAIQLNHEFLADDQVIKSHRRVRDYQELLLDTATLSKVYLASNLNFSVTKKRLTMMTNNTSQNTKFIFASATIPLFACLLMLFSCSKTNAQKVGELSKKEELELKEAYFKNTTIVRKNKEGQKIYKPYIDMSAEEKAKIPPPPPHPFQKNLEPLPKGSLIELEEDGKVLLRNNSELLAPPPPPKAPKAPEDLEDTGSAPVQQAAPVPSVPPAYESLPAIELPETIDVLEYVKDLVAEGTAAFFLESGREIEGEKTLEVINKIMNHGGSGYSFTPRMGKGDRVELYFQGFELWLD